ncbi:Hypothetical protein D9617_11g009750 [Elsinoe fawcettii]|nr:Hypothetical protein D9617_11g009750 [Elsinoe fawcettii]
MAAPKHSIVPTTKDDVKILARYLQASKLQLAINRFVIKDWPNEKWQLEHYTAQVKGAHENPDHGSYKVVDEESGEILAHLVLTKYAASTKIPNDSAAGEAHVFSVPDGLVPEFFFEIMNAVQDIEWQVADRDRLDLTWFYVRPQSRRQGIGSQLVKFALARAKEQDLPLVTAAEPQPYDFMKKRGFKDTKHADFDLAKWAPPNSGYGTFRLSGIIAE